MKKRVVKLEEAHTGVLHDNVGIFRILIDEETSGAKNFALLVNTHKAGPDVPDHKHDVEQCAYILEGKGKFYQEDEVYDVGPGTALYSPAGVSHRLIAEEDVTSVVFYAPAGPERQLRTKGANAFK